MRTLAVLLCAGLSRRHAPGCKLIRPFRGAPLVVHAADSLAALGLGGIAVVPPDGDAPELRRLLAARGFAPVINHRREAGRVHSLRLGVHAAAERGATAALIALGDMPLVPRAHLAVLLGGAKRARAAVTTVDGVRMPPWLCPAELFGALSDPGAMPQTLLRQLDAAEVALDPAQARDVDTPEDFAAGD